MNGCERILRYDETCLSVVTLPSAEEIPHINTFVW